MNRTIKVILVICILLMTIFAVSSYAAVQVGVYNDGNKLISGGSQNVLTSNSINITLNPISEIKSIAYTIGTESKVTYTPTASKTITIPSSYIGKQFYITLEVVNTSNQTGTLSYYVALSSSTNNQTVTLSVYNGSTKLSSTSGYVNNLTSNSIKINITPITAVSSISYYVGTESKVTYTPTASKTITIPSSYIGKKFNITIEVTRTNGQTASISYLVAISSESTSTTMRIYNGSTQLKTDGTINDLTSKSISLKSSTTSGISSMAYTIGTESKVTYSPTTSKTITIPNTYEGKQFYITYEITKTNGETQTISSFVGIKSNQVTIEAYNETLKLVNTSGYVNELISNYIAINVNPIENVASMKYKIGSEGQQTYTPVSNKVITIPDTYIGKQFNIIVEVILNNGETNSQTYIVKLKEDIKPIEDILLNVYSDNNSSLVLNNVNALLYDNTIKYSTMHSSGIKSVTYCIDNSALKTATNETIDVQEIYKNGEQHTLVINVEANDGTVLQAQTYYIVYLLNNLDYKLILNTDEILNNNISGLNVSLRNIAAKEGNDNVYSLGETVKYHINFANYGATITDKVTIEFRVPQNVNVEFIDKMNGIDVGNNTIRWTFSSMESMRVGTIVLTLKYTQLPSTNFEIVNPTATIKSNSLEDASAIINLIYKNGDTKLNVNHMPYMFGDAENDNFRPTDGLSRAEMAIILVRIFNIPLVTDATVTYKDAELIATDQYRWSTQAIMTVTKYGLMEGYEDGTFRPGTKVTKAQLIAIIARRFEVENNASINPYKIKDNPITLFKTNTSHWAIPYISQLMRLNMLADVLQVNGNPDDIITRAEVTRLVNTCLLRGGIDNTNSTLINRFDDVNSSTKYYADIVEATANPHNSKFTKEANEVIQ